MNFGDELQGESGDYLEVTGSGGHDFAEESYTSQDVTNPPEADGLQHPFCPDNSSVDDDDVMVIPTSTMYANGAGQDDEDFVVYRPWWIKACWWSVIGILVLILVAGTVAYLKAGNESGDNRSAPARTPPSLGVTDTVPNTPCVNDPDWGGNESGLDECSINADCTDGHCLTGGRPYCSCGYASCLFPPHQHTNQSQDRNYSICCCQFTVIAGRPFMVDGIARTARHLSKSDDNSPGWVNLSLNSRHDGGAAESQTVLSAVSKKWVEYGLAEHASIASFSRHSLQLLALGAPATLVEEAHRAALDEIQHARICFGMAAQYSNSSEPHGPGQLDITNALPESTNSHSVLQSVIEEGVVGETTAAVEAALASLLATDSSVSQTFRGIANDEARHAALGWKFVHWRVSLGSPVPAIRDEMSVAFHQKSTLLAKEIDHKYSEIMRGHGILSSADRRTALHHANVAILDPLLQLTGDVLMSSTLPDLVWAAAKSALNNVSRMKKSSECRPSTLILAAKTL